MSLGLKVYYFIFGFIAILFKLIGLGFNHMLKISWLIAEGHTEGYYWDIDWATIALSGKVEQVVLEGYTGSI